MSKIDRRAESKKEVRLDAEDLNLHDYLLVMRRYGMLVAILIGSALSATYILTKRTPSLYKSTMTILIPRTKGTDGSVGGLSQSQFLQGAAILPMPSLALDREILLRILKSRVLAEAIVKRFHLQERYREKFLQDAVDTLRGITTVSVSADGIVSVQVVGRDPILASRIANSYGEYLKQTLADLASEAVMRQKATISAQLSLAKAKLKAADAVLRALRTKLVADGLYDNEAASGYTPPSGGTTSRKRQEVSRAPRSPGTHTDAAGRGEPTVLQETDGLLPYGTKAGPEAVQRTRNREESLVTLLTLQLEEAEIAKKLALAGPVVQVLDAAVPAVHPFRPRLRVNLMISGSVSLFMGVFLAFLLEHLRRHRSREEK